MTARCGFSIESNGLFDILMYTSALLIAECQVVLGLNIPLGRSHLIPADSLFDITDNPLSVFITVTNLTLCLGMTAECCHLTPLGRLCDISSDPNAPVIADTQLILGFRMPLAGRLPQALKCFNAVFSCGAILKDPHTLSK